MFFARYYLANFCASAIFSCFICFAIMSRFFTAFESSFTAAKLNLRFVRVLELKKRTSTIECASNADLVNTLTIVKSSEENGEIDSVIDAASVRVRKRFVWQ